MFTIQKCCCHQMCLLFACCVSACVLQVKQNTELVGRSIFLRVTRAGRVESGEGSGSAETGSDAGAADMDSTGTDAAMLDKTDLVLMGECGQLLLCWQQDGRLCHCVCVCAK